MLSSEQPNPAAQYQNAFGFLRLLFASLVIVAHVPEIVDNSSHRELLTRLTGTISFGTFAVYGFFVISGYLITQSSLRSPNHSRYMLRRVARIYPAFALASLVCVLVVAPLSGERAPEGFLRTVIEPLWHIAILARPRADGAFPGQYYNDWLTALNGAMWTIQYEFLCYLIVWRIDLVPTRWRFACAATASAVLLVAGAVLADDQLKIFNHSLLFAGPGTVFLNLTGMFLAGATFTFIPRSLKLNSAPAIVSVVLLLGCLLYKALVTIGFAIFGSYLILFIANRAGPTSLGRINRDTDISYGVYLYAWPIEQLLIRAGFADNLLLLGLITWLGACLCGWVSWTLLEKPTKDLIERRRSAKPAVFRTGRKPESETEATTGIIHDSAR